MTDNLRWLIALSALSVTIAVVLSARRSARHRTSGRCALAIASFLVAWSAAEIPPFGAWGLPLWPDLVQAVNRMSSPQILVACAVYLVIAIASGRTLIGLPIYRQLESRADELAGLLASGTLSTDMSRMTGVIRNAEKSGARCIRGYPVWIPLADVIAANRTLNGVEKQIVSTLCGPELRMAASQIAALMPTTKEGMTAAKAIAEAATSADQPGRTSPDDESRIRNATATALVVLHRDRDTPQEREVEHIRVALWLTLVGLATMYAVSVTFPGQEQILVAGALGGLLGSMSALIMKRSMSLGMVVLSPVAGALNALGGVLVVAFLAQDEISLLGKAFGNVWTTSGTPTLTALAVAILLGFSGGLFARLAVTGTAPLLGNATKPEAGVDGPGTGGDSTRSSSLVLPPTSSPEQSGTAAVTTVVDVLPVTSGATGSSNGLTH